MHILLLVQFRSTIAILIFMVVIGPTGNLTLSYGIMFTLPNMESSSSWSFFCTAGSAPIRYVAQLDAIAVVSWP